MRSMTLRCLVLTLSCWLLAGCAELDRKIDVALYGSVEEAEKVHAKYDAQRQEAFEEKAKDLEDELYRLIGDERRKKGVFALPKRDVLQDLAHRRVQEVADKYSDIRPDGSHNSTIYKEFPDLVRATAIPRKEVRASGPSKPSEVFRYWMSRSKDKEAILDKGVYQYAVAVCMRDGTYYWVFVAYH